MSQLHSVILLPQAKSRSRAPRRPFPWKRVLQRWPYALALLAGWAAGFFHGSQHVRTLPATPPVTEAISPADAEASPQALAKPLPPPPTAVPEATDNQVADLPIAVAAVAPSTTRPLSVVPAFKGPESPPIRNAAPAPGTIRIESRPEKAEVYAADKLLGVTPLQLLDIPPGNHTFRVEKERHTRKLVETRVKAGATVELSVELQYDPEPCLGRPFTSGHGIRMQWVPWLQGWAAAVETPQMVYETVAHENASDQKGPDLPVTNVTWSKAMKFCDLLTIAERGLGFLPEAYAYALPSDEEWSRLAEGTPLSLAITGLHGTRPSPAPVASLPANELGLHDIRGNVWEWCRDSYTAEVHRREVVENATGDPSRIHLRYKVLRGGSWNRTMESNLGLGFRLAADGNTHSDYETGFRVILVPVSPNVGR